MFVLQLLNPQLAKALEGAVRANSDCHKPDLSVLSAVAESRNSALLRVRDALRLVVMTLMWCLGFQLSQGIALACCARD